MTEKLGHACKLLDKITSTHVTISVEKNRHIVEVVIHSHGATLHAKEETHDMYSSIDQAVDKIETQAKRLKEKIKDHKHAAEAPARRRGRGRGRPAPLAGLRRGNVRAQAAERHGGGRDAPERARISFWSFTTPRTVW